MTPYDEIRYPGRPRPQTHPDLLSALGQLFGLAPAAVESCRVLELGCGNAANLAPMAYGLPQGRFVGVDLAATAIAEGRVLAAALGLNNLELQVHDLAQLPAGLGEFDYIVAHGVYSWVPEEVRNALLAACARHLAPQGIAFVSYNALPGGYLRRIARDMMRFHTQRAPDARTRVAQSLALMTFFADSVPEEDACGPLLRKELERIRGLDPALLIHDDLADVNEPVYFHKFVEHASRHGLRYFAEAEYFMMSAERYAPAVRGALAKLGENAVAREQYLDFLACRPFRQSLLCRDGAGAASTPLTARLAGLRFSSPAAPAEDEPSLAPGVEAAFRGSRGKTIRMDLPLSKAALLVLHEAWPRRLGFAELQQAVAARLRRAGLEAPATAQLADFLLAALALDAVEVHAREPRLAVSPGARPRASALARRQAAAGEMVASLTHRIVNLSDETGRRLLVKLDGTRDRDALLAELAPQDRLTPALLERHLNTLARLALLEA